MDMRMFRLRRVVRHLPRCFLRTFREPIAGPTQLFGSILAWLVLAFELRGASPEQRDLLATEWATWVKAAAIAVVGWAAISFVYAPVRAFLDDQRKGRWHGSRFVYHQPQLVAVERCVATGNPEQFRICFADAEPAAWVDVTIEVEHPFALRSMFVAVFTEVWLAPKYGQSHLFSSMWLPKDRTAHLVVQLKPLMQPETVRVYMTAWSFGDPLANDGTKNRPDKVAIPPVS